MFIIRNQPGPTVASKKIMKAKKNERPKTTIMYNTQKAMQLILFCFLIEMENVDGVHLPVDCGPRSVINIFVFFHIHFYKSMIPILKCGVRL